MSHHPDARDVIDAGAYSVEALRKMVFKGEGPLARPLALSLLGRKRYPRKAKDLERLLMNDSEIPRLRNMAAVELGRLGTPAAARVLEQGLKIKEDLSLRGVLEGLSLARVERLPPAVNRLTKRKGLVGETARHTAMLLSHRLRARVTLTDRPEARALKPPPREAALIEIATPRRSQVVDALATVAKAAPAVALTDDGATSFLCEDRTIMFLLGKTSEERLELADVLRRKVEVGIVVGRTEREHVGWSIMYHVLTEPIRDGEIGIVMSTAKGKVMLEGTAHVTDGRATFQIRSIDGAGALPIAIEGTFDGENIAFKNVRAALFRRPSEEPSLLQRYRTAPLSETLAAEEAPTKPPARARRRRPSPKK